MMMAIKGLEFSDDKNQFRQFYSYNIDNLIIFSQNIHITIYYYVMNCLSFVSLFRLKSCITFNLH